MKLPVLLMQFEALHFGPNLAKRILEPSLESEFNQALFEKA